MGILRDEEKLAEKARVSEVADHIEEMAVTSSYEDKPWLERAAKLLRRWGIDLP